LELNFLNKMKIKTSIRPQKLGILERIKIFRELKNIKKAIKEGDFPLAYPIEKKIKSKINIFYNGPTHFSLNKKSSNHYIIRETFKGFEWKTDYFVYCS